MKVISTENIMTYLKCVLEFTSGRTLTVRVWQDGKVAVAGDSDQHTEDEVEVAYKYAQMIEV